MPSLNEVRLLGNLGGDPEKTETPQDENGDILQGCQLRVATKRYRGKGREDEVTWHRIIVWGPQAESCMKYLKKGALVFVSGRIHVRSFEGREGKKTIYEIVASEVQFLDKPQKKEV